MVDVDTVQGPDEVQIDESAAFVAVGLECFREASFFLDGERVESYQKNETTIQFVPEEEGLQPGEHVVQFRATDRVQYGGFIEETKRFSVVDGESEVTVERWGDEAEVEVEVEQDGGDTQIGVLFDGGAAEVRIELE